MRGITTTLLTGLLGIGFGFAGGFVPSDASAVVFCSKNKKPDKIKVRGSECKDNETEVSVLDNPDLDSELGGIDKDLNDLLDPDRIYVVSETRGGAGLRSVSILCDENDVATGGGVTSFATGSAGPFLQLSGPELDDFGTPIGWRMTIRDIKFDIEVHVICFDVGDPTPDPPILDPDPPLLDR